MGGQRAVLLALCLAAVGAAHPQPLEQARRTLQQADAPAPAADAENVTESLLLLKAAVDPAGKLTTWAPGTSFCSWQGVVCDASGSPVSLDLQDAGLAGQLPLDSSVWGGLASLRTIDVSGNNVSGFVPAQIMQVGSLQNLSLANNGLQGPLPDQLGPRMEAISYRGNQLTGTVPPAWGNSTGLRSVDVSDNGLSGTLPPAWASLAAARYLNFSANNLTGSIPADWRTSAFGNATVTDGQTQLQYIGFGGNPGLCIGSDNGGNFLFPRTYNLPCSPPDVVSLAPPLLAPALAPGLPPALAPAAEVPAASPDVAPVAALGLPTLLSPGSAPLASPAQGPALPVLTPAAAPEPAAAAPGQAPAPTPEQAVAAAPVPAPAEAATPTAEAPTPAPSEAASPGSAPAPSPSNGSVPVSTLGTAVPPPPAPAPAANSSGVTVAFNPGQLAPPSPPTGNNATVNTNLTITGADAQQFRDNYASRVAGIFASLTGQDPSQVNVTSVNNTNAGGSPTATTGRRRLLALFGRALLQSGAVNANIAVSTSDPTAVQSAINQASADGRLRSALQAIGLDLSGQPAVTTSGSTAPTAATSSGGGHSAGYYLAIILPTVLGGLLAIILVALILWCCLRRRRSASKQRAVQTQSTESRESRGTGIFGSDQSGPLGPLGAGGATAAAGPARPAGARGGDASLVEGLMYTFKHNPIFNTDETQSSRGDDYEVINVTDATAGGARRGSGTGSISGMRGMTTDVNWASNDPPVGDAGPSRRLNLAAADAAKAHSLQTRDALSHPGDEDEGPPADIYTTAHGTRREREYQSEYRSGMSYVSAAGAPGVREERETFESPRASRPGSPARSERSAASFNSAQSQDRSMRTAGSFRTSKSAQTEFFDALSHGESFDYDQYQADAANPPVAGRRAAPPPPRQRTTANPLYAAEGEGAQYEDGAHPILDNPIFTEGSSPRRSMDVAAHPVTSSGDLGSVEGHPVVMSGGGSVLDSGPASAQGHPITYSGGSILDSGGVAGVETASAQGHPITYSGGSILDSGGVAGVETASAQGHPITFSGGSTVSSGGIRGVEAASAQGHPVTFFGGSTVSSGGIRGVETASAQGHPVTYSGGSVEAASAQGHPITYSGGSILSSGGVAGIEDHPAGPASAQAHPVTFSGGSTVSSGGFRGVEAASAQGHPITYSGGSILSSGGVAGIEDHPAGPASAQGHPVTFSGGSTVSSGGIRGVETASTQGHPITYSGGSILDSGPASLAGHPVTASGLTASGGSVLDARYASAQGHPVTYSGGSLVDSYASATGTRGGLPTAPPTGSMVDSGVMTTALGPAAAAAAGAAGAAAATRSPHRSSGEQAYAFGGQVMQPATHSREAPESDEEAMEVDHPHMRSSFESDRGVPFIAEIDSPTGSHPDITGSDPQLGSLQGHALQGSGLSSHPGSAAPASVQGHPITGSDLRSLTGSGLPASVQGHPITGSDLRSLTGSGLPASVQGHPITGSDIGSITGSGVPASVHGHPITGSDLGSITGSGAPASVQGFPITGSDLGSITGSGAPGSVAGHPITGSDLGSLTASGGAASLRGLPLSTGSSGGYGGQPGVQTTTTSSSRRATQEAAESHSTVTRSGGVASLAGHPITGSSMMGSITGSQLESIQGDARPASLAGFPVTYSGGSDLYESGGLGGEAAQRGLPPADPDRQMALQSQPEAGSARTASQQRRIRTEDNPVFQSGGGGGIFATAEGPEMRQVPPELWETGRGRAEQPEAGARALPRGAVNPMFGSTMSSEAFEEARQETQANPLYDSRRSPSTVGFTTDGSQSAGRSAGGHDNPMYNNESLLDTVDSEGGERNPLFDSMTGQPIPADRGHRNALFGSNILDSLDTSARDSAAEQRSRNPLFESSNRTGAQSSAGVSTQLGDTSSTSNSQERRPAQQGGGSGGRKLLTNLFGRGSREREGGNP